MPLYLKACKHLDVPGESRIYRQMPRKYGETSSWLTVRRAKTVSTGDSSVPLMRGPEADRPRILRCPLWRRMSITEDLPFRAAWDAALGGMLMCDPYGRILHANPTACRILRANMDSLREAGTCEVANRDDPRWDSLVATWSRTGRATGLTSMVRLDGAEFLAEISLSGFTGCKGTDLVCVSVRDVTRQIRKERRILAYEELTESLLVGAASPQVLDGIARHACSIFEASFSCISMPVSAGQPLMVVAAHGVGADHSVGNAIPPGGLAEKVIASGSGILVEDMAGETALSETYRLWHRKMGPGMVVPMVARGESVGALYLGGRHGRRPYGVDDLNAACRYATSAGVINDVGVARNDRERGLRSTVEQLEQALQHRVIIEQAKGYISALRNVSMADSFILIRSYARSHNETVQSVARQIVDRRLIV